MSPKLQQFLSTRPKSFPSTLTVHVPVVGWPCCWLCLCRLFGDAVCWFSCLLADDAFGCVFAVCLALPFAGFPGRCLWLCLCCLFGVAVCWFSRRLAEDAFKAMSLRYILPMLFEICHVFAACLLAMPIGSA